MAEKDTVTESVNPKDDVKARYQKRMEELQLQKQEILMVKTPAQQIHDSIVNDPKLLEARKVIKACNAKLGPIDQEMSMIARALGGKVLVAEGMK